MSRKLENIEQKASKVDSLDHRLSTLETKATKRQTDSIAVGPKEAKIQQTRPASTKAGNSQEGPDGDTFKGEDDADDDEAAAASMFASTSASGSAQASRSDAAADEG